MNGTQPATQPPLAPLYGTLTFWTERAAFEHRIPEHLAVRMCQRCWALVPDATFVAHRSWHDEAGA